MRILFAIIFLCVLPVCEALAKVPDVRIIIEHLTGAEITDDTIRFEASGLATLFIVTSNDDTMKSKWVSGGRPAGFVKIAAHGCAIILHPNQARDPLVDER